MTGESRPFAIVALLGAVLAAPDAAAQTKTECLSSFERAQEEEKALHLGAARELYMSCARACPTLVRQDCAEHLEAVTREVPTLVLGARLASGADVKDARVFVDDALVTPDPGGTIAVDPGPHTLRFEKAPYPPQSQDVVARTGEKNRLVVVTFPEAASASAPAPSRVDAASARESNGPSPWAYVAGGVGLAAVGSFAFFGLTGADRRSELRDTCRPTCPEDDVSALRTRFLVADVSLAVAVVAFAVSTYLFMKTPARSQSFARSF